MSESGTNSEENVNRSQPTRERSDSCNTCVGIVIMAVLLIVFVVGAGALMILLPSANKSHRSLWTKYFTDFESSTILSNSTASNIHSPIEKRKNEVKLIQNQCSSTITCDPFLGYWCFHNGTLSCYPGPNGWLVWLRRVNGDVNFSRGWDDYIQGFGNPDGDYWLGLENLHKMTTGEEQIMIRVEVKGLKQPYIQWAEYNRFSVSGKDEFYRLSLSGYTSNMSVRDNFGISNGFRFNTRESPPSAYKNPICLYSKPCQPLEGGWWHYQYGELKYTYGTGPIRGIQCDIQRQYHSSKCPQNGHVMTWAGTGIRTRGQISSLIIKARIV